VAKATAKAAENQYDERREGLVVEQKTTWPAGLTVMDFERAEIAKKLHANPKDVKKLEYIRCPTGFVRHITVSQEDLDKLA
jgi:hypothetical protein